MINREPFIMIYCAVCFSTVVIWWISSESFSTFVLSSTTLRPSADTQSTARTAFLPACEDTHNTHSERRTGRDTKRELISHKFPLSRPFTLFDFHTNALSLSTTPETREKLKTLSFEKVPAVLGEGCMSYNAWKKETHTSWFGELWVFTLT